LDLDAIDWYATVQLAAAIIAVMLALLIWRMKRSKPKPAAGAASATSPFRAELSWRADIEDELASLKRELAQLREEVGRLRAARGVAPQYGEAMALAQHGHSAEDIAGRCGISVAEAELIRALGEKAG